MAEIAELIKRREKLEGPSEELGTLLLCQLLAPEGSKVEQSRISGAWCIYEPVRYGKEPFRLWEAPAATRRLGNPLASLDAAVGLVERVTKAEGMGEDITVMLPEAIDELCRSGFRRDEPFAPQVARHLVLALIHAKEQEAT